MTNDDIKLAYYQLFPLSYVSISKGILGSNDIYGKGFIQNKNEWANKISHNDPLNYMFSIDDNGLYTEHSLSIQVKPKDKYMYSSSEKLRKKTIKNIDNKKLIARFYEIKEFIILHKDNMLIDINDKL